VAATVLTGEVVVEVEAQRVTDGDVTETAAEPLDTHAVVVRYESMVYAIAVTHTGCRGDADDVFQDVFLTYHRRQPEFRSEEHRKAWLITTTINCARQVARSSWRTRVVPLTTGAGDAAPVQFEFETVEQNALFAALTALPASYRSVLHLFYFEDLSILRIAEVLELTASTVKMRLSRGRVLMRERLTQGVFDE
jgi:RNA polymerase sigma-70 factor (ECF subfamily)